MLAKREWITPLTVGAFILTAVTGILMLFHMGGTLTRVFHEWLSLIFVLAGLLHAALNWKPLKQYACRPTGAVILVLFLLLTFAAFLSGGQTGDHRRGGHLSRGIPETLLSAPISTIAPITQTDTNTLIGRLREKGLQVSSETQSIRQLAQENKTDVMSLLQMIFE